MSGDWDWCGAPTDASDRSRMRPVRPRAAVLRRRLARVRRCAGASRADVLRRGAHSDRVAGGGRRGDDDASNTVVVRADDHLETVAEAGVELELRARNGRGDGPCGVGPAGTVADDGGVRVAAPWCVAGVVDAEADPGQVVGDM